MPRDWPDLPIRIVIPVHNRWPDLERCLLSITQSELVTGLVPSVLVVHDDLMPDGWEKMFTPSVEYLPAPPSVPWCKSLSLNVGIDAAAQRGPCVIALLDADMVVGPKWLMACHAASNPRFHRVAFVVRGIIPGQPVKWGDQPWFESLRHRYEAWDQPWFSSSGGRKCNSHRCRCWGNSQGAMRSDVITLARHDERYMSRGFEDLDFLVQLMDAITALGEEYRGLVWRQSEFGLLHYEHDPKGWDDPKWTSHNLCLWNKRRHHT